MALPKPTTGHLEWTDGSVSKVQDPGSGKKLLGWEANERPAFEFMNWNFYVADQWLQYLESITDELAAETSEFNAIVGSSPNATHATLQAAIAAASNGWKILVLDAVASQATTVTVSMDDIEIVFKPGAHYNDSGANISLQITGDRCRIRNGRFTNFSTAAIQIQGTAVGTIVTQCYFSGNASDVDDGGSLTQLLGNVTES